MRALYLSEWKAIRLIAQNDLGIDRVLKEDILHEMDDADESQGDKVLFNRGFAYGFPRYWSDEAELVSSVHSVTPSMHGCDLCLTIDATTNRLMMLELMNIRYYGPDCYSDCIEMVQRLLAQAGCSFDPEGDLSHGRMSDRLLATCATWYKQANYVRVMSIHGAVCFHAIRRESDRERLADPEVVGEPGKYELAVYRSQGLVIGLDGWLDEQVFGGAA